jgi:hypothetical protein
MAQPYLVNGTYHIRTGGEAIHYMQYVEETKRAVLVQPGGQSDNQKVRSCNLCSAFI